MYDTIRRALSHHEDDAPFTNWDAVAEDVLTELHAAEWWKADRG